ncbi:glutathione S-transferase A-like [Ruditapes philippinarum]|uniref:glutathione S-transferase A-like n=1 Tax=Ruditapes philippinarum TaxID=129788 RepID=UPI00295B8584|nr:glutathione S-transferase A-like [Ruditapes philippinarum]
MSNKQMHLWWGSGSAPCWKPMLVLAEKGLWEGLPNTKIEFSKKEHKQGDVLKYNPRGQVPTFKDGDLVVNESGAICMYLEEKYSKDSNKLLPADVNKRAEVYQRMFESPNLQTNVTEKLVYYRWMNKEEEWDKKYLEEHTEKAKEELSRWNTILGDNDYLCGKEFTMADVFVYPVLAFLIRSGAKLPNQPALMQYYKRVTQRPSVQATWPPHWKEGEGKPILSDL